LHWAAVKTAIQILERAPEPPEMHGVTEPNIVGRHPHLGQANRLAGNGGARCAWWARPAGAARWQAVGAPPRRAPRRHDPTSRQTSCFDAAVEHLRAVLPPVEIARLWLGERGTRSNA